MAPHVPVQTLERQDGHELVRLPPLVLATTEAEGGWRSASRQAFRRLAHYLFGRNAQKRKMPMTAPVLSRPLANGWEMAFVLSWTADTPPKTEDPDLHLLSQGPTVVARGRFSGIGTPERFAQLQHELESWVRSRGWRPKGEAVREAVWARYDPPWTLPWLRRNEVWLPLDLPAEGPRWLVVRNDSCRVARWVRSVIPRCSLQIAEVAESFPQIRQWLRDHPRELAQPHLLLVDPASGAVLTDEAVVEELLQFLPDPTARESAAKALPSSWRGWLLGGCRTSGS